MHAPKSEFQFGGMHSSFAFKGNRPPELSFEFNYHDPPPPRSPTHNARGMHEGAAKGEPICAAQCCCCGGGGRGTGRGGAPRPPLLPRTDAAYPCSRGSELPHSSNDPFCSLRFHVELYEV